MSGPGRASTDPSGPGRRPMDPGSSLWPAGTPRARQSASSSMPPPPIPPSSPSPLTPTSERPTSARSSSSARACPRAPTAGATARPSPPARSGSPIGCGPSSAPTGWRSSATSCSGRLSPPEHAGLLSMQPTGRSSWSRAPSQSMPDHRGRPAGRGGGLEPVTNQITTTSSNGRQSATRSDAEADSGQRPGTTTEDKKRIAELEREVHELRRANDILKAASAYFARELDPRYPR